MAHHTNFSKLSLAFFPKICYTIMIRKYAENFLLFPYF